MEVWIVENGQKRGPFRTYEIRERIEREELDGSELAWHKDQDEWVELREMDVFRSEFETVPEETVVTPPPLPSRPHLLLRFFARWFDVCLYRLLIFAILRISGQDLVEAFNPEGLFLYIYFLPFVIMEAIFIHLFKTTPGKFLLGIRVVTPEEGALPLRTALVRSLRVYIVGMGLLVGILPLICHALCLWYVLKNREAPWDTLSGMKIRVAGPFLFPVILFVLLFLIILTLLFIVLLPTMLEMMEKMEKMEGETAAS